MVTSSLKFVLYENGVVVFGFSFGQTESNFYYFLECTKLPLIYASLRNLG